MNHLGREILKLNSKIHSKFVTPKKNKNFLMRRPCVFLNYAFMRQEFKKDLNYDLNNSIFLFFHIFGFGVIYFGV